MDENKYLILIDEKDKTSDIENLTEQQSKIDIKFIKSNKPYTYGRQRVLILQNPLLINPISVLVYLDGTSLFNIIKILDFKSHVRIFYTNGKTSVYTKKRLTFEENVLTNNSVKKVFNYLKDLAKSIKDEDNDFLEKQYEGIKHISEESILTQYLSPKKVKKNNFNKMKIFPFGFNLSQEIAVTEALTNQISIIEGPPGTGKTQTILNILANLVINDKTVAVVSNNNTAITNVFDKLDAQDLSFFSAVLGNKKNQEIFFENQKEFYQEIQDTTMPSIAVNSKEFEKSILQIRKMLHSQNKLAKLSQELEELTIEKQYFMELYAKRKEQIKNHKNFTKFSLNKILSLWADFEYLQLQNKKVNLFFKIKTILKYKIFSFAFFAYPLDQIILFLQNCFYIIKERVLTKDILELKNLLKNYNFDNALDEHKMKSMMLFKSYLSKRYDLKSERKRFNTDVLWKEFGSFTKEYPVILSTTHSLRNSTGNNFLYDYLIIDEASQVDIVAGSLALSCAKNVVIVGDLKQLPHIVKSELEDTISTVLKHYNLNPCYHYKNNLLLSFSGLFKDAPKTLLKEHYRCHPKIIDFCNKKFYNNELIILSKNKTNEEPLILYKTVEGNHARGTYNQRQIDVIKNEIMPHLTVDDIGIISPFRKQVNKLNTEIDRNQDIEIDTVHKYQGREKDVIIITTVVDKKHDFADNPNLLNVAISRAKDKLYVVVSDNEKNKNMKDLVNYIKYNNFEIKQSKIYSIFDLLYQSYAPYLNKYLNNLQNASTYKSENLMNIIIDKALNKENYKHLGKILHFPLNKLIKDTNFLNTDEFKFVQNPLTHIDFLIYNKINKQAILVIEVDGVAFHENNPTQLKRDKLKDNILEKYNIPIIRFATNGSEEEKKLFNKLKEIDA